MTGTAILTRLVFVLLVPGQTQQRQDPDFDARVEHPAYPIVAGPHVLFDEAHHNFHTASGRYKPFADLVTNDGYRVTPNTARFTREVLAPAQVLVIANALGAERMGTAQAADSAFSSEECDAVRDWVREGGSLLLITDHYPTGSAAASLGKRFGVRMSKGMTDEYEFTPERGLAAFHPIVKGQGPQEQVRVVRTFTGQSLQGPQDSTALLTLPEDAKEMTPDPLNPNGARPIPGKAVYRSQAVAFPFGKGRVVVLGEAAMLTAQISQDERVGMNVVGVDNRQLALNIMHWLSRQLDPGS